MLLNVHRLEQNVAPCEDHYNAFNHFTRVAQSFMCYFQNLTLITRGQITRHQM